MALVTTTEMFQKAYEGGYAVGAFNINNMEIIQAITEAAAEDKSPVILQVSAGRAAAFPPAAAPERPPPPECPCGGYRRTGWKPLPPASGRRSIPDHQRAPAGQT